MIWTANAFALLGLASLLALVDILVRRFRYLGKTIALILAFVGMKILAAELVHIIDSARSQSSRHSSQAASSSHSPQIASTHPPGRSGDQTSTRCPKELANRPG